jgi:hypothetical protein
MESDAPAAPAAARGGGGGGGGAAGGAAGPRGAPAVGDSAPSGAAPHHDAAASTASTAAAGNDAAAAASYLALLAGAVFGDPGIASNVLSCLHLGDATTLRAAGTLTRGAVSAFPWSWRTQRGWYTRIPSLRRWRACFGAAVSVEADGFVCDDADLAALAGVREAALIDCTNVTDVGFRPLAASLTRLSVWRCSLTGATLTHLTVGRVTEVDVRGLRDGVVDADLRKLGRATTVLLGVPDSGYAGPGGAVSVLTDAGLAFLRNVRRLRVPAATANGEVGITRAGIASLARLTELELLLPVDTDAHALLELLSGLPPTATHLTLQRDNDDHFRSHYVALPLSEDVIRGLHAPLSRLKYLTLEGLIHSDALLIHTTSLTTLLHTTSLTTLRVYDCSGVDMDNFARLQQLRHLAVSYAYPWMDDDGEKMLCGLHSLVSLRLYIAWPGYDALEALGSLPSLRSVWFGGLDDGLSFELEDVLEIFEYFGPGNVDFDPRQDFVVSWTSDPPTTCPCCGRDAREYGAVAPDQPDTSTIRQWRGLE